MQETPLIQRVVAILWPSFLVGGAATALFFTAFDPVHLFEGTALAGISRLGGYTLGFFAFWLLGLLSSGLTCYFQQPCDRVGGNGRPGRLHRKGRDEERVRKAV